MSEINGILNVYKPLGITSHDVVYKIRRLTGIKKVGHTGTLDPDAEGVLPICIGKATKVADMLTFSNKRYTAKMKLGVTTDTQDASGKVISVKVVSLTDEQIRTAIQRFIGEIEQVPPMYSAIKIGGKKLYELARKGIEVERTPRKITIFEANVLSINKDIVEIDVLCSKGTYIRTLCQDIGEELGCGAHMAGLIRTQSSIFTADKSYTFTQLENGNIEEFVLPVDEMFGYPKFIVEGENERKILNGNSVIIPNLITEQKYRVYDSKNKFICISKECEGRLSLIKSFY